MNDDRAHLIRALQNCQYPGARDELVLMVIEYCEAAGLDPLTKPVHIVPMRTKNSSGQYVWRDQIMPGIEMHRTKAHRTGQYAGCSPVEWGPTITQEFTDPNGAVVTVRYPEYARITVRRRLLTGEIAEFSAVVYWQEAYVSAGRSEVPNAMWQRRPRGQLEKCAEAAALRKGFPEEVGGIPVREEMEGRVLEEEAHPDRPAPENRLAHLVAPAPTDDPAPGVVDALIARLQETLTMPTKKAHLVFSEVRPQASTLTGSARDAVLAVWSETMTALRERAMEETLKEAVATAEATEETTE